MLDPVDENIYQNDELKHWGIIGMKWGIRRYQNPDGTLTPEGRERYGVKTVDDTKKLSYSKDYLVLKQKKNRTELENRELKMLEIGKKHFENSIKDPEYFTKLKKDKSDQEFSIARDTYNKYLDTTNYGKGMAKAGTLLAVPVTAIGALVDTGAVYLQFKAGMPIAAAGLASGIAYTGGYIAGASIYEKNHNNELAKELKIKK